MAHTAIMGALSSTCNPMTMSICTCITSLVERVIRLAVENFPISAMEKDCTWSNSFSRRVAEKLAAILAAQMAAMMEAAKLPKAQASILPPAIRMSLMALPWVCTKVVISDM